MRCERLIAGTRERGQDSVFADRAGTHDTSSGIVSSLPSAGSSPIPLLARHAALGLARVQPDPSGQWALSVRSAQSVRWVL